MKNGFLGYQTSFMLDFVVVSLVLIVPVLVYSLYCVKAKRNYRRHRNLQLALGVILLVAVGAFEVDLHWIQGGWKNVVSKREVPLTKEQAEFVHSLLRVHLLFAVTTPILWGITIGLALRSFPHPLGPSSHSQLHKKLGWLSTADIVLTSVTGLVFYYFAFAVRY